MVQIIAAIQQKGGAGKSAMIDCLAGVFVEDGAKVLLIDTDPQASSVDWAELSKYENLDHIGLLDETRLYDFVKSASPQYNVILIDTAGFDSLMATYVTQIADLILIPTNGSKKDIMGAAKTWKHIEMLTSRNDRPPTVKIAFWKVNPQTSVFKGAKALAEEHNMPVLPGKVKALVGFENMSWNGKLPDGAARQSLLEFIFILKKENLISFYIREEVAA